ncbi:MAG: carbamate kinase [Polyangiaceae bacterium]|nr:carbamate kinase [Polyangiaceae bacterium]
MNSRKVAVVALGGNALLRAGEVATSEVQTARAEQAAHCIAELITTGFRVVIIHGNGPQVGNLLLQMESAAARVPPSPLDVAVAATQGTMGYLLERALRNELSRRAVSAEVTTLLTLVEVDPADPAFVHPEKPVGPVLSPERARHMRVVEHASIVEERGRGFRKTVPSPLPISLVEAGILRTLVDAGIIVMAGGGGGIPVVREQNGVLRGIEAVIDKDRTAVLLARAVRATHLVILTEVEYVEEHFGQVNATPILKANASRMRELLERGEFPPGNMGPKIEAALDFLKTGGEEVIITSLEALPRQVGTHILP